MGLEENFITVIHSLQIQLLKQLYSGVMVVTRVWKIEYSSSSIPIYGEKVAYREGSLVGYHFFLLYWQNDGWVRGTCDFRFYCNTYCQISIPSKCARLFNYSQPSLITVKYISLPNSIIVLINPNIVFYFPSFLWAIFVLVIIHMLILSYCFQLKIILYKLYLKLVYFLFLLSLTLINNIISLRVYSCIVKQACTSIT